jgi:hypothetical protein
MAICNICKSISAQEGWQSAIVSWRRLFSTNGFQRFYHGFLYIGIRQYIVANIQESDMQTFFAERERVFVKPVSLANEPFDSVSFDRAFEASFRYACQDADALS